MLTALALLLVQSVIELPDGKILGSNVGGSGGSRSSNGQVGDWIRGAPALGMSSLDSTVGTGGPNNRSRIDDEVVIITSYQNAMRTAHTFLLVFLRKYVFFFDI
ncbi:unnamed protein product [Protopolystoma xenopodis]|uniref:Uncharacterized protein n=1 Tax=Protopolystoma xenopodis TaxID=117903 RepID=A0A448WKU0_9PLAT|nr:unnamed protein product [Protopolystoma xenopodis]